ncbi:MAG: hypothetical protein K2K74_04275 [Lachnospiraceae bacterium]|nr:hypothetical protein [Lachnospiraceae bacterium]
MTENEAIGWIKRIYIDTNQSDKCIALKTAISALLDVQKYRANCDGCKNNNSDECMHCMRAYSDCYESV